ncbi:UMP-CMP kinase [Russula ochroleuca]|jgi:UMP-CMP kinase|uniref:Uridylate kinase n=1 Tax=Russula ochroleuca TaxID=152965 RepID=A0A9P5T8L2_9AGAM|nr:UMP-CMP kinase [Russula ochroleuca]
MAPNLVEKIADALHIPGVHKREGEASAAAATAEGEAKKPIFEKEKVTVIFVLGGPGAGKGTQCSLLVEKYSFSHLSAGDLLRAEQDRPNSHYGDLIRTYIREGQIVPMEVTIKLLENAMRTELQSKSGSGWEDGKGRFLIDGFPRKMDQALKFEEDVCQSSLVLFFTTDEETMLKRLLKRGETSGRDDDNIESIKKRFVTYKETTMPVIEHYEKLSKVAEIDSSPEVDEVHTAAVAAVEKVLV